MKPVTLSLSPDELGRILSETAPGWPLFPELEAARTDIAALRETPTAQMLLQGAQSRLCSLYPLPQTTYTVYREFQRTGERRGYERPYFEKRTNLTAATLALFLGQEELLDVVQDHLWDICEESNWVLPAHEWVSVDLFAAETGFQLAETLALLRGTLHEEIVERVQAEIERRILQEYLAHHDRFRWFHGTNNWNGVCNGSLGSTFLLLEANTERLGQALSLVLSGLETFLNTAFEADGASTEGVGYWQYGLMNAICFAEMLRGRTRGQIDILSSVEKLKAIALYPLQVMLSPGHFANFSDSEERSSFHPGIVARLAERTGQAEAMKLLAGPGAQTGFPWRLAMALRTMLWWDGTRPERVTLSDAILPAAGVARLVAEATDGTPLVVAFKAGHNAENHNQNDVGTFVVHAGGETYLCDPGRGLYSGRYFSPARYENLFANSYGHSVPVVDGQLQATGREYKGQILDYIPDGEPKQIVAEIGGAYPVENLQSLRRTLRLAGRGAETGAVTLIDAFTFAQAPTSVLEAFLTWLEASVEGNVAVLHGERHDLKLTIEAPTGATLALESLDEACRANAKAGVLKRLTADLPPQRSVEIRIKMELSTL